MSIESGVLVFFKCPKRSWTLGYVQQWDAKKKVGSCKAKEGDTSAVGKLTEEDIFVMREDIIDEDVHDLLHLTLLHDSTLLDVLKRRYLRDVIYTNIGAIVVALNPFNFKIPYYTDDKMPEYLAEGDRIERNMPHSWAVAHNTYWEMMNDQYNQCILVSGESGAGKTEASKIVMKYLAALSCKSGTKQEKDAAAQVGTKINRTSPPLEAYGNARTVRNDNSSRFGKFMKVKFSEDGFLTGAHITKYLLEKSRIVTAAQGERVYHSFYLVLQGKDKSRYGLLDEGQYRSVSAGKTWRNKEYDTSEEYDEVCEAMRTIGYTDDQVDGMWRTVAGILFMLNIEFDPEGEGCLIRPSTTQNVTEAVRLWEVDKDTICRELVVSQLEVGGQVVEKLLPPVKAIDGRDALVKALYDAEFGWLVDICNSMLDRDTPGYWIGLLDIFGFEDFEVNSFEQFCINLANETLQGYYNQFIFTRDMDECRAEGVDVTDVKFPDNSPCLQMMMGKGGICPLLDEECALGKGTDDAFLNKVTDAHRKNPFFLKKPLSKTTFIIHHYAGSVEYEVTGFLEKNRDTLKDGFRLVMRGSSIPFIRELLAPPVDKAGQRPTVGKFFKMQLAELMDLINSTNPHWIRCVKPHPAKKPLMFDGVSTMHQLASAGVLGTVKIRKAGYPVRIRFEDFYKRYKIIGAGRDLPGLDDLQVSAQGIIAASGVDSKKAQVGKSRVFLKTEAYVELEQMKKDCLAVHGEVVQAFARALCDLRSVRERVYAKNKALIESMKVKVRAAVALQREEAQGRTSVEKEMASVFEAAFAEFTEKARVIDHERIAARERAMQQRMAMARQKLEDEWRSLREALVNEEVLQRAGLLNVAVEHHAAAKRLEKRRLLKEAEEASQRAYQRRVEEQKRKAEAVRQNKLEKIARVQEFAEKERMRKEQAERRRIEEERKKRKTLVEKEWRHFLQEEQFLEEKEGSARLGGGKILSPAEKEEREQRQWKKLDSQRTKTVQQAYMRQAWEQMKIADQELEKRERLRDMQAQQEYQEKVKRKHYEENEQLARRRRQEEEERARTSKEIERIRQRQTVEAKRMSQQRERARQKAEEKEWKLLQEYFESVREVKKINSRTAGKMAEQTRQERFEEAKDGQTGWVPLSKRIGSPDAFCMSNGQLTLSPPRGRKTG